MNLGKIVNALLKANATVTGIVGSGANARIYPDVIPQEIDRPAISYDVGSLPGVEGDAPIYYPNITISAFAPAKQDATTLAQAVDAVMDGATGYNSGTTLKACNRASYQELFDPELNVYSVTLTYETVTVWE